MYIAVAVGQGAVGNVTELGAAGAVDGVTVKVYGALLNPHELTADTLIVALTVPAVRLMVLVVLVPLHPVPVIDHVYVVAPVTAGTV